MPTGAVLLAELTSPVDNAELEKLRQNIVTDLHLNEDDFYSNGPLRIIPSRAVGPVPTAGDERSTWIEVNLWAAFFWPDYSRGDIEKIVRCAEWVEAHLPGCRIWYGHDVDDDNLAPFPAERRQALLRHAKGG